MNRSMKQMLSMLLVVAMMAAMLVIPSAATATGTDAYTLAADTEAVTLKVGETKTVKANVVYGVNKDTYVLDSDVVYTVAADSKVVSTTYKLDKDTLTVTVKAVAAGKTDMVLTVDGKTATVKVTVEDKAQPTTPAGPTSGKFVLDVSKEVADGKLKEETFAAATPATQLNNLGTDGLFTIITKFSGSSKIEAGAKTFEDGYESTHTFKTGGGVGDLSKLVSEGKCIMFTTGAKATVKVWWTSGSGDGTVLTLSTQTGDATPVAFYTSENKASGVANVTTIENVPAGTCFLSGDSTTRFYKVEVYVGNTPVEPSEKPEPSDKPEPSENPEMTVYTVKPDAASVTVRVNATKTVKVTTEPANGKVYVVSADAYLVDADVNGNVLTVKGLKAGKTNVVLGVKDGVGTATVAVTVNSGSFGGGGGSSSTVVKPTGDYTAKKTTDRDGNVTITVTGKDGEVVAKVEIPATIPTLETKFVDVPDDHWAAKSINDLAALGLVNGVAENTYDMNSNVTRGSLATILFRLAQAKGAASDFTDVASDAWYAEAVGWAAKVGVIAGKGDNTFGADESITREQLALMLYRFAKLLGVDTRATGDVNDFADGANTSDWATEAMTWAVGAGILQGNTANELMPTAAASRAETACMVDRFISLLK